MICSGRASTRSSTSDASQLACFEFVICLQMVQANVCDLALLEEAVADDVLSALLLALLDQAITALMWARSCRDCAILA